MANKYGIVTGLHVGLVRQSQKNLQEKAMM